MNKKLLVVLLLIVGVNLIKSQTKEFEGNVVFKGEFYDESVGENVTMNMNYFIKGNKFKAEIGTEEGNNILISDGSKTYMIIPQLKQYMDLTEFENEVEDEGDSTEEDLNKAKTGETKEILGYKCEKYIFKEGEEVTEVWVTKELGSFMFTATPAEKALVSNKHFKDGFFPLEIVIKDKNGKISGKVYATKLEKMKINDNEFTLPKEYTKMQIPNMEFNTEEE